MIKDRIKKTATILSVTMMLSPVLGCVANASHRQGNTDVNRIRVNQVTKTNRRSRRTAWATDRMIEFGRKLFGTRYSQEGHVRGAYRIARGNTNRRADKTDTSGFTWGLLKHNGFKVSKRPWIVGSGGSENRFFKRHHETVRANKTRKGTVVMANRNPHNAILLQKWHGKNTKVLEEGGSHNDVNVSTYKRAFGSDNRPSEFANPVLK